MGDLRWAVTESSGGSDLLLGMPIGQLTLSGIALGAIALLVIGLLRGLVIPKATHEREIAQANQRAEDYKEALAISEKRGDVLEQIGVSVTKLLDAIPRPDDSRRGGTSP